MGNVFTLTSEVYNKLGRIGVTTAEQCESLTKCKSLQELMNLDWIKSVWKYTLPYGKIDGVDETKQLTATFEMGALARLEGGYPENGFSLEGTTGRYDTFDYIDWTSSDWYHANYWRGPYGGQHHPSCIHKHDFVYNVPQDADVVRICGVAYQNSEEITWLRVQDGNYPTFNFDRVMEGAGPERERFALYYINSNDEIKPITDQGGSVLNNVYPEDSSYVRFVQFNACYNNGVAMEGANSPIYEGTNLNMGYNLEQAMKSIAGINSDQGRAHFFTKKIDLSFWIFATNEEAAEYLRTGNYSTALNYDRNQLHGDFMNLNVEGNSEQINATYDFIDPVAGLAYNTPQQIKINWTIQNATANPFIRKETTINIPINAHCFVLFTGKYVGVYCNKPGVTMEMNTYNNDQLLGTVTKQSDTGLLEIQNIFGMYEGYEPEGGTYNVKIYTPFIFIRQIYKCASKEELPQKGDPTYEIFQPGTSSAYVNPNDTGELASVHLLSFNSISEMKAASDAEN